jgi:hypothetical protein
MKTILIIKIKKMERIFHKELIKEDILQLMKRIFL